MRIIRLGRRSFDAPTSPLQRLARGRTAQVAAPAFLACVFFSSLFQVGSHAVAGRPRCLIVAVPALPTTMITPPPE
jgi:hypothetical protein